MSYQKVELSEVTSYIKRGTSPKYVEDGYLVLNQKCVRDNTVNFKLGRKSSKEKKNSLDKFIRVGDTLINSTGKGTLGRVGFVKELITETIVDTHVTIVRPIDEKIDPRFLGFQLFSNEREIELMGKGATNQTELSAKDLEKLKINLPPLPTQKKIASILSAYDDLIENNLKRIQLLEEAAQRIYKEWFVDFKFPNHENTPINKETGLPEGWGKKKLIEIYNKLESGKRPKGGINKDLKDGVPSIGAESVNGLGNFEFSKTKFLTEEFYSTIKKGILENKDILIYKDGAYIGKTALYQNDFPYSKCAVNEHVFLLNTKKREYQYYLYFTLNTKEYYSKMQNLNSNAAQPGINQKKLLQLELYLPLIDENMANFNDLVGVKITQIYKLASVNYRLKEARDLLLPRLMNRTLEV